MTHGIRYQVCFQLGGCCRRLHREWSSAVAELVRQRRRARKSGDCQTIYLVRLVAGVEEPLTPLDQTRLEIALYKRDQQ